MTTIHHINCGTLHAPPHPKAICHCLLLEDRNGLALVDTGIGLLESRHPVERLGQPLIDMVGYRFHEADTAVRRVEALGFRPEDVRHAVLTHCDPDHTGGLADLPHLQVHVAEEERASLARGHFRYVPLQFAHGPDWRTYAPSPRRWFGLEARPVALGFESEVLLIPLFGHTLGHCGVAVQQGERWVLHVGDSYYLRVELTSSDHPVCQLTAQRAVDDAQRRASLEEVRRLVRDHGEEIELFGYHDSAEFPG
ncbi:MAG TPA: MBL fold metallo-hydrolase [Armatimonadota bacterium]|nr:MBL fold metallo-hydrolase [Armatimonadota bacterium]